MRNWIGIIFLLFSLAFCELPWLRVGLGGSFISQRYTLLEDDTTSLTSEGKFLLDGNYEKKLGSHIFRGEISSDIGDKSTWAQLLARWQFASQLFEIESSELVEGRVAYSGDDDVVGYGKHRFNLRLSQNFGDKKLSARLWAEGKRYEETSSYYYNYDLLRSKISYRFGLFGADDEIAWSYSYRSVPDSADANYDRRQIQLSASKLWNDGNFGETWLEYDRKHFPSESEIGSYSAIWSTSQLSLLLSRSGWMLEPSLELENRNYDTQDDVFFDYLWLKSAVAAGKDFGMWNFSAGPLFSTQSANDEEPLESYTDWGAEISVNYFDYNKFWLFLSVEPGKRFYKSIPDTGIAFSNYNFVDLSLISSVWLIKNIRADVSASYFPEWHTTPHDDIATSYISVSLRYEFY